VPEEVVEAIRTVHTKLAIVVPNDVDTAVDAVAAALGLADDPVSFFDAYDGQQLTAHAELAGS
jgi:hypothetical protein